MTFKNSRNLACLLTLKRLQDSHSKSILDMERKAELKALSCSNRPKSLSLIFKRRLSNRMQIDCIHSVDGSVLTSPSDISGCFNEYFLSCYSKSSPYVGTHSQPSTNSEDCLSSVSISLSDIRKQLLRLRESKTAGPDGLPASLLKHGGPDIPDLLFNLFNLSLNSGEVPTQWKRSIVIPHFKAGSRLLVTSYRGVHHTCLLSRILERIIKPYLLDQFTKLGHISSNQYGFLSKRSVGGSMVHFFDWIAKAIDTGAGIVVIYLDIRKAFDVVSHDILLSKLRNAGVVGTIYRWIASYLSGRSQATSVAGSISSFQSIPSGVVQGSVLGPVFFLLFINDIVHSISFGTPFLFADDLKIAYSYDVDEFDSVMARIQNDLDALSLWSNANRLHFATEKCQVLMSREVKSHPNFTLSGNVLTVATQVRDLGILYSCKFSFAGSILIITAKAKRLVGYILTRFHDENLQVLLFKQHVRPLLEFPAPVAPLFSKRDRLALEGVQRYFTRLLLRKQLPLCYRERCIKLHLDPLWLRRARLNLCYLFRLLHGSSHIASACPHFKPPSNYSLRSDGYQLEVVRSRTSFSQNSFLSFYPTLWNNLPIEIRSISIFEVFKSKLYLFFTFDRLATYYAKEVNIDTLFEEGWARL